MTVFQILILLRMHKKLKNNFLTLCAPVETLVLHAVGPVPPDIVHVFLPITPGHFQHDHGKA